LTIFFLIGKTFARFKPMQKTEDPEDKLIRVLLISAASGAVLTLILVATVIAVMISYNFNILNWME
jgi:hypothetical protein